MTPTPRSMPAPTGETTGSSVGHSLIVDAPLSVPLPEVEGVLSAAEVEQTAASIAEVQREDGMIPWSEGGHCDPWNHTEAAMGLTIGGFHKQALLAYQWLADSQLPDGSWFNYYLPGIGVKDPRLDTQRVRLRGHRSVAPLPGDGGQRGAERHVAHDRQGAHLRPAVAER